MTERPRANVVRRGHGLPVVAIHGNGVDHRILLAVDEVLSRAGGLQRIYLDLPGFGSTPPLRDAGGLPEIAAWLLDEIPNLVGERSFALLANSLGGLLARHVHMQLPDRVIGIALLAPVVDPDPDRRRLPAFTIVERDEAFLASLPESELSDFTALTTRQTRQSWGVFEEFVLPGLRAADEQAMARLDARYYLPHSPDAPGTMLAGPALIVTGKQDHIVGYEDQFSLLRRYPHATYAALHGAGHNCHVDQPANTEALLHQWALDLPR